MTCLFHLPRLDLVHDAAISQWASQVGLPDTIVQFSEVYGLDSDVSNGPLNMVCFPC